MSFDQIKRDLAALEGRSDLSLEEMLALFRSLEADLSGLDRGPLRGYRLTEQELASEDLIPHIAWLGNLFQELYSGNQTAITEQSGRFARRSLAKAQESVEQLNREQDQVRQDLARTAALQQEIGQLEAQLRQLQAQTEDSQAMELRRQELQGQVQQAETVLRALTPPDLSALEGRKAELEAAVLQARQQKQAAEAALTQRCGELEQQRRDFEAQTADHQAQTAAQEQEQLRLTQQLEQQKQEQALLEQKTQQMVFLLDDEARKAQTYRTQIDQYQQQIDTLNEEYAAEQQKLTQLRLQKANQEQANETFTAQLVAPAAAELTAAQTLAGDLQREYEQSVAALTGLNEQIAKTQEKSGKLKLTIDDQRSQLEVAQRLLDQRTAESQQLTGDLTRTQTAKQDLEAAMAQERAELTNLETNITSLTQARQDRQRQLAERNTELTQLQTACTALEGELALLGQKTDALREPLEQQRKQRDTAEAQLGALNSELTALIKQNQELEQTLQAGDPVQTKATLEAEQKRLLQEMHTLDSLKATMEKVQQDLDAFTQRHQQAAQQIEAARQERLQLETDCERLELELKKLDQPEVRIKLRRYRNRHQLLSGVAERLRELPAVGRFAPDIPTKGLAEIEKCLAGLEEQILQVRTFYQNEL